MRLVRIVAIFACCVVISGCAVVESTRLLMPEKNGAAWFEIMEGYESTTLKVTDAAEVLDTIVYDPNHELLSQSESLLAASGESKGEYKFWVRMVRFSENNLTAERKYALEVDERPKQLFVEPWPGMRMESEMVLDEKTLNAPFADENDRRIGIFRKVLENIREDFGEVKKEDARVQAGGMMVHQAFVTVLNKLEKFPSSAKMLEDVDGLEAHHPNLDKVRIRIRLEGDIVKVRLLGGSYTKTKEWSEEEEEQVEQE